MLGLRSSKIEGGVSVSVGIGVAVTVACTNGGLTLFARRPELDRSGGFGVRRGAVSVRESTEVPQIVQPTAEILGLRRSV